MKQQISENTKKALREDWLVREINILSEKLSAKYGISRSQLFEILPEPQTEDVKGALSIPVELFSDRSIGALQILVKFLVEHKRLSYGEISRILSRDNRTIWRTYSEANKKHPHLLMIPDSHHQISVDLFSNRALGPLEVIVVYLKDNRRLNFAQIARLLYRDPRTIWATYSAALKKIRK